MRQCAIEVARWATLLLCLVTCSAAAPLANQVFNFNIEQPVLHGARRLLDDGHARELLDANTTSTLCLWLGFCDINLEYVTTLNGLPTSNSAKVLASIAYKNAVCGNFTSQATCEAKEADSCTWDYVFRSCSLSVGYFDLSWLRGLAFCADSRADAWAACAQLRGAQACAAAAACRVMQADQVAGIAAGASFVSALANVTGTAGGVYDDTTRCVPAWLNDTQLMAGLGTRVPAGARQTGAILSPLFDDLFGRCADVSRFRAMLAACPALSDNATACRATPGCDADASGCDLSTTYMYQLYLDTSDTWVKAYNDKQAACSAKLTEASCARAGAIAPDLTKYQEFAAAKPYGSGGSGSSGGGGGAAGLSVSPLLLAALAALAMLLTRQG